MSFRRAYRPETSLIRGAEIARPGIARPDNAAPDYTDRNGLNIRWSKKKSNVLNDKRITSCLSRHDSGAYSRLQFLRAVSHSVGAHTKSLQPRVDNSSHSNSSEDEDKNRQALVPAAPTSGASESATAATATTSDDCCEVCIVAPRAGFAPVPCEHRTRRQYTMLWLLVYHRRRQTNCLLRTFVVMSTNYR